MGRAIISELVGTVQRENAFLGVLLTLEESTKPMVKEAVSAGFYHSEGWNRDYRKIQILTVEQVLNGDRPDVPPNVRTYPKAKRVKRKKAQKKIDL